MKRFVFSLQTVYNHKLTVEKLQKTELSNAQAALSLLLEKERQLIAAFERNKNSLDYALKNNIDVVDALEKHDAFFRYVRDAKEELKIKIIKAEKKCDECRERLVITMKEIKAYEKLKEEQYRRYLAEVAEEEQKEISDLVSFNYISDGEN